MAANVIRRSSDRSLLVLTSPADGPTRGYALVRDIQEFAGVRLGANWAGGCGAA